MNAWSNRPTISLFGQLLTLTLLVLAAAHATSLFMIFNLPPPTADFYRMSEVAQALQGAKATFSDRRPLEIVLSDKPPPPPPAIYNRYAPRMQAELARELKVPISRIAVSTDPSRFTDRKVFTVIRERSAREGWREELFVIDPFQIALQQADGRWRIARPYHPLGLSTWHKRMALWFFLSSILATPIVYLFARRLSAPIGLFATAAERLGRDPGATPLTVKGSSEIAVAVRAFNDMQRRLQRYVEDRTEMVGAIAHDLRTPLTRLRFRIETLPDEQRAKMAADLDQMEAMITATLTFVRDASHSAERTPLELSSLVESVCDEMAETGYPVTVGACEKVVVDGDPMALRRLLTNLLENAVKFGGCARARVFRDGEQAVIEIDDDGPGIPVEDAERVFDPFYRREPSRSRQTGGIGLGLAVVRSIARGHGGDVILTNRVGNGLTARVQLPADLSLKPHAARPALSEPS